MNEIAVRRIMTTNPITLDQDHSFNLAEGIMHLEGIRHLPITDGDRLVGLVSHRDLAQAQASFLARPAGDDLLADLHVPVSQIMRTHIHTITPDTPVTDAARILRDQKYGCLPVVDGGRLVGIVTETDFLTLLIEVLDSRA